MRERSGPTAVTPSRPRPPASGERPEPANPSSAPSANTSPAGSAGFPPATSGARNSGSPTGTSGPAAARTAPAPISRGPSSASSTADGVRSRWGTPAPCRAARASASWMPSVTTAASPSGPLAVMNAPSDGPPTKAVTSHGSSASVSASSTGARHHVGADAAVRTSCRNRSRSPGSIGGSPMTMVIATRRPFGSSPSRTRASVPSPRRPTTRYRPNRSDGGCIVAEGYGVPVTSGHRPSAPAASAASPTRSHHCASLPSSSRQAQSRVVSRRRECSRVKPMAPWT